MVVYELSNHLFNVVNTLMNVLILPLKNDLEAMMTGIIIEVSEFL